jgi:hypothetical protein
VKRLIAFASLVALTTSAAISAPKPAPTPAPKPAAKPHGKTVAQSCHVAPADEYFGKLKMSVLGIRNTIRDQGLKVDVDSTKAPTTLTSVGFAEDALRDWEHKYPCDRWIPWTIYALEHFYTKIHTADGVKEVHRLVAWLKRDYPKVGGVISFATKDEAEAVASLAPPPSAPVTADTTPAPAPGASAEPQE